MRQGALRPIVAQRFPLDEARRAQELPAKGGVSGKIVLFAAGAPSALEAS